VLQEFDLSVPTRDASLTVLHPTRVCPWFLDSHRAPVATASGRVYPSARPDMLAATATHCGSYEGLHASWDALQTWLGADGNLERAATAAFPASDATSM
jgi:hypothetical protein